MADKKILLDVEIKAKDALKELADLRVKSAALKKEQKELDKTADDYILKNEELAQQIKAVNASANERVKTIQNEIKRGNEAADSMDAMKAKLSLMTAEYNKLSKAERETLGKDMAANIKLLTHEITQGEEALGNYRRNVGNYVGALNTLKTGFGAAGVGVSGFTNQMNALAAQPYALIIISLVKAIQSIGAAFTRSEEQTNRITKAFSIFNPLIDKIRKGADALAKVLVDKLEKALEAGAKGVEKMAGWLDKLGKAFGQDWGLSEKIEGLKEATAAATALSEAEIAQVKRLREFKIEEAKINKEIQELRAKNAQKDKYNANERLDFLNKAIQLETSINNKKVALEKENLRLLEAQAARGENDLEMNNKLAEAKVAVINAEASLYENTRKLNAQRATAIAEIEKEKQGIEELSIARKDYDEIIKKAQGLVKKTDQDVFDEAVSKYNDVLSQLGNMDEQRANESNEAYRDRIYEQAKLVKVIEEQKNEIIKEYENKAFEQRLKGIEESYSKEIALASDNAIELANIEIKKQQDIIAEKKIANKDTELDEKRLADLQIKLANDVANEEKRIIEERKKNLLGLIGEIGEYSNFVTNSIGAAFDVVSNLEQAQLQEYEEANEKKQDALDKRLENGEITQEEYNKKTAENEKELEAEQAEVARNQAKRNKALALMQAIINTSLGISKAIAESPMTGGLPGSALAATLGGIQIAAIAAEPLPKASRGVLLSGKSHAQGGIPIEAEGGEAIINKRSTAMFTPLLSAINEAGGGVRFANGGMVDGGFTARFEQKQSGLATSSDIAMLAEVITKLKIYLSITDLKDSEKKFTQITNNATF